MIGIVFAAGIGSRLKPFTDEHPKALAPVCGATALDFVINRLINAGARHIIVNVHHFPEQVKRHILDAGYKVPVHISDESDLLLDTGGALAKIWREQSIMRSLSEDEPIIVHNADILTDFTLTDMERSLQDNIAALLVDPDRVSSRRLLIDSSSRLCGWLNCTTGQTRPQDICADRYTKAAFGGVHILSSAAMLAISDYCGPELHPFGIMDFYLDSCCNLKIHAYTPAKPFRWHDIGTPEKLLAAQKAFPCCKA